MFLACPACDTHYRLDDLALPPAGRKVRCTACGHVWRAAPPPAQDPPNTNIDPFTSTAPIDDADMRVDFAQDALVMPDVQDSVAEFVEAEPVVEDTPARRPIPEGIFRPAAEPAPAMAPVGAAAYMPLGMTPLMLGVCVFLVPFLLTLATIVVFRAPLSQHFPALDPVYAALGLSVAQTGDGLRLSTLVAERKIDNDQKTLSMSAMIANVSPVAHPYPALTATAYDAKGGEVKSWAMPAPADKTLASGEEAPIRAVFKDVPDEAARLELKVTRK